MNKRNFLQLLLGIAMLGILDAGYLTYEHYMGGIPPCTINGCETVLTSPYATLYGFPISLLGVFFYASVLVCALILHKKESHLLKVFLLAITSSGFLFSLFLFYLQAQVLNAFCQYCLISFFFSTILFISALFFFLKKDSVVPVLE